MKTLRDQGYREPLHSIDTMGPGTPVQFVPFTYPYIAVWWDGSMMPSIGVLRHPVLANETVLPDDILVEIGLDAQHTT